MLAKRTALFSLFFAFFITLVTAGSLFAQDGENTGKNNGGDPKIKGSLSKILELADGYWNSRRFSDADKAYRAALVKDPSHYLATYRVAKCNQFIQEYEEAVKWYEGAIALDPKGNDTLYFDLGTCYRMLNRNNDALEVLEKFRKRYTIRDEYAKRVKLEIEGCKMVEKEKDKLPEYFFSAVNFNTTSGDMFPAMLNQNGVDSFIVFTSHRSESMGNEGYAGLGEVSYTDLWIVKMEDDTTFNIPENLGKKVNTKMNDGSATFSPDGLTMYYSICNSGKLGYGCSIYQSDYEARKKAWGKPVKVEGINGEREVVINTRGKTKKVPTWDVQPALSADGNTMFFVSDREGGWGKLDIWFSTWDGEGWSEALNAGPNVNTGFDDLTPFLNRKANKLFFSSDGRIGYGGRDMYESNGSVGSWEEPTNLGAPINSSYDDFGGIWLKNDSLILFTSNRDPMGRDDIYYAKRKPRPEITVAVHGIIRDRKTKQPVPFAEAILFMIDFEGDLVPIDTFKTDMNAEYNFPLERDREYKIVANAPEYLANEENFSTKNLPQTDEEKIDLEHNIDILIERIIVNLPIVLNNIYYDFDKDSLRSESQDELDKLIEILEDNPNITIEIGSHTDSNGSEDYNKELAERRAKAVVTYLIDKQIQGLRLSWYGYGESQLLIYPELSDEDEQINRRSEFRIKSINFAEGN